MNTISCACNDEYKLILGIVASRRRTKIGELVRWAIDTCLEDEIKDATAFFYASASSQKHNDVSKETPEGDE